MAISITFTQTQKKSAFRKAEKYIIFLAYMALILQGGSIYWNIQVPRKREGTPTITMKKGNMTLENCFNSITYDQLSVLMIISPTTISLFYAT